MVNHEIVPLSEMSRYLRVKAGWLKDEADAGRVPCLKAGDRYLFNPAAVEATLARRASGEQIYTADDVVALVADVERAESEAQ